MRIALGIDSRLDDFARRHSAQGWRQFARDDPLGWKTRCLDLMSSADLEIDFNLDGVEVWKGVQRAAAGGRGSLDWEWLQIDQNPSWWPRVHWWRSDRPARNPFGEGEADAV